MLSNNSLEYFNVKVDQEDCRINIDRRLDLVMLIAGSRADSYDSSNDDRTTPATASDTDASTSNGGSYIYGCLYCCKPYGLVNSFYIMNDVAP